MKDYTEAERIQAAALLVQQAISLIDNVRSNKVAEVSYETQQRSGFNRKTGWRRPYTLRDARQHADQAAVLVRRAWEVLEPIDEQRLREAMEKTP